MSQYRLQSRVGDEMRGMAITVRDRQRMEWIARWYSLTNEHLGRMENGWASWWTMVSNDRTDGPLAPMPDGTKGRKASNYLSNLRRRMGLLSGLQTPGSGEGLVAQAASYKAGDVTTGWWITRAGRDVLGAPYQVSTEPSLLKAQHTWDAADLGFQMEDMFGLTVLGEREIMSGQTFRDGETREVPVSLFQARRIGEDGRKKSKRPDIAIVHRTQGPTGLRLSYTAVEVERVVSRPIREYKEKLVTYQEAPDVDAVWYLCDRKSIRDRVRQAWEELVAAHEVVDDGTTPRLIETVQHWWEPSREQKRDGYLRRRVDWVGLPGVGLDGSVLPNSKGQPSAVGTRMRAALEAEQDWQGVARGARVKEQDA